MKLKPYPEYKDSGVPWLGEIPAHWDVKPGIAFLSERKEKNVGMKESTVLSLSYGQIIIKSPDKLHGLVPESFETYQIVEPGNIIIRGTDLQNDKVSLRVGKVRHKGIITSAYLCLQAKNGIMPDYAHVLLHAYDLMKVFYRLGSGLRQNLSYFDFKRLEIIVPSKEEQRLIHEYVRSTSAQINKFIRNKRRLIGLLKEQKQNIINRAVTRGIDPNVKLKPSGVEWLGDIPEHWTCLPIKRLVSKKMVDGPHESPQYVENGVPFVSADAVSDGKIHLERRRANISWEDHRRLCRKLKPRVNDIFIVKSGSTTGKSCIVDFSEEFSVWSPLALVRVNSKIMPYFMFYAITGYYFRKEVEDNWSFGTQPNIGMGVLENLKVTFPESLSEQENIVNFIERSTSTLDQTIARAEREIELMTEYRARLISDVVTGKVDVRGIDVPQISEDELLTPDDEADVEDELLEEETPEEEAEDADE